MAYYRIGLVATTFNGRLLTEESFEVAADLVPSALDRARQEFFRRTRLVSGVRLMAKTVERRREPGAGYAKLTTAYRATPGTRIKLEDTVEGRPWSSWVTVDHWEPQGDGTCLLVTTDPQNPHGGIYAPHDVFETC
jgi:hypothetical protein